RGSGAEADVAVAGRACDDSGVVGRDITVRGNRNIAVASAHKDAVVAKAPTAYCRSIQEDAEITGGSSQVDRIRKDQAGDGAGVAARIGRGDVMAARVDGDAAAAVDCDTLQGDG